MAPVTEKLNPHRVPRRMADPKLRVKTFDEVVVPYTEEELLAEARRCILCPKPLCVRGCPAGNKMPFWIKAIQERDYAQACRVLRTTSNLSPVCGRVCAVERQCELRCVVGRVGDPVAIGALEAWVADRVVAEGLVLGERAPSTGKRVAVVGSGPAGLAAAEDLARRGHRVTLFEALPWPGGILIWGIPEFRLPRPVLQTIVDRVRSLDVEIKSDTKVGESITLDGLLKDNYDAVFLGIGAAVPTTLGVPGEDLEGVYLADQFLSRVNLMRAFPSAKHPEPPKIGRRVAVVGAGNTAIDAVEVAVRLGAEEAYIVYRRSEVEMPARHEEVETAKEEGVIFKLLTNPVRILGDSQGRVVGMECIEMTLGEPDASGRRRPIPKPGSEFVMELDTVLLAIGFNADPLIPRTTPGLEITKDGLIIVDPATGRTMRPGVWAGGDIVTGPDTVVAAMAAGKRAAADIDAFLRS